jgi:hypothetical protein
VRRPRGDRLALAASLVAALPFAIATWEVEREVVPWLVASAALELVYFFTLTAAYARAERRSSTRSHAAARRVRADRSACDRRRAERP